MRNTEEDGFSCLEERAENLIAFLKTQPSDQSRDRRDEINDQEDGDDLSYETSSGASWGDERASRDGGGSCCSYSRSRSSVRPRRHSSCTLQPSARARRSQSRPRSMSHRHGSSRRRHRDVIVLTSPRAPPAEGSSRSWKRSRSRTAVAESATQYSRSDDRKRSGRKQSTPGPGQQLTLAEGDSTEVHMNKAQILQGLSQKNNEPTWQAHIMVPQITGGTNYAGRLRTFTVRCPVRLAEDQALEDAKRLEAAAPDGPQAVRAVANELQRTKTRDHH